jgi:exodeoxyribonuclease-5
MMRADLPLIALADLPGGSGDVVLCATARLAVDLRRAHGEAQARAGRRTWHALQSATLAQWLDHLSSAALLRGEIPAVALPGRFLTRTQERNVWEEAILADTGGVAMAELFDHEALAQAAMEATMLSRLWRIEVPEAFRNEEHHAFLRWQAQVDARCRANRWLTQTDALLWRIGCLERGAGQLPQRLLIAGFTAHDPALERVLATLEQRGVVLFELDFGHAAMTNVYVTPLPDAAAECRAAAAWARERLARAPQARLRIAVADMAATQRALESALDAALHPQAVGAGWAGVPRAYVFVDGSPLAELEPVATALRLLRLCVSPRQVALTEFSALLCGPGWSRDVGEADLRARLDAALRERLPPEATLERMVRAALRWLEREHPGGMAGSLLAGHLAALLDAAQRSGGRATPSVWATRFSALLEAIGWPGERPLLASERTACDAFTEVLAAAALLDGVAGRIDAAAAWRELRRQCGERRLQIPHAPGMQAARIEVCHLADALGGPVDGLWLMGINEGVWPSVPRPNPLLPAAAQRSAGIPVACAARLAAAARREQQLWCSSASEVVFSWAEREGERELRPSPLLAGMAAEKFSAEALLADVQAPQLPLEFIADARAPAVTASEQIRGGTALLAAQAVCPAWAFYRYRLGAAVLPTPTFGLDARSRGALLHLALEAFWRGRAQADLLRMQDAGTLATEIGRVVQHALDEFNRRAAEPLPPRLSMLEAQRLQALLARWLMIEAARPPFRVLACEERHEISIEGLPVRLVVDRIDALDDGRLVILDYKSGKSASAESWAQARPTEPQLPIYAACVFPDRPLAAVALARVVSDAPGFAGIAAEAGVLPEVKPLDEQRRRYASADFPDWAAVRQRWAERITELAREVKDGVAAVVVEREAELDYCDVKPLLRLAERRRQWERSQ